MKDRREREKENLRQRILEAARDLFFEEGYDRVTIRRIADAVEYAPGTIYLYFRDKDEIFAQICDASYADLISILRSQEEIEDPLERLRANLTEYVRYGVANPRAYEVLFVMKTRVGEDRKAEHGARGHEAMQYMVRAVEEGQARSIIRSGDPMNLAIALWASAHGITHIVVDRGIGPDCRVEEVTELLVDIQISGLRV